MLIEFIEALTYYIVRYILSIIPILHIMEIELKEDYLKVTIQ